MLIQDRDRQIVLSVARFGQLTTTHIQNLHFHELASSTPLKRSLARLLEQKLLQRIERRLAGGTGAGSGQYVYQLGSAGWSLARKEGRYWPFRAVNFHTLGIANAHIELLRLEREGRLQILGFTTEPDTHVVIAGADLRPDLFEDVAIPHAGKAMSLWIEIDMGTERATQLKDKLARYWHAFQNSDVTTMPVFPVILFIAPDDTRARELRWIIERGDKDAQELFLVSTMPEFGGLLFG